MKSIKIVTFVTIGLIACIAATGCKRKPGNLTVLPKEGVTSVGTETGNPLTSGNRIDSGTPAVTSNPPNIDTRPPTQDGSMLPSTDITGRPQDRTKWQNQTVHFDFDRYVIKAVETEKIDTVAREFKTGDPNCALLIEGHCDERGTPGYNMSLGEKRAMAIREYLIRAGVSSERIHTISFGKEKPVALGHDDASWSKNRRGEFILVLPK